MIIKRVKDYIRRLENKKHRQRKKKLVKTAHAHTITRELKKKLNEEQAEVLSKFNLVLSRPFRIWTKQLGWHGRSQNITTK